jgi:hypothetical protein
MSSERKYEKLLLLRSAKRFVLALYEGTGRRGTHITPLGHRHYSPRTNVHTARGCGTRLFTIARNFLPAFSSVSCLIANDG